MRIAILKHGLSVILTSGLALAGALTGSAQATVFETSASLPLIGVAYVSPSGAGCFIVGVCVTPGPFVLTSATSSFDVTGQEIMANAVYGAVLTLPPPAPDTPIGSVALTGTVDETVLGRTSDSETGSFNTLITGLQLTGNLVLPGSSLDGATLLATLDRSADIGRNDDHHAGRQFVQDRTVSSTVFIDVSIPDTPYSRSGIGPIPLVAVAPEPSTWAMMLIGFAGLGLAGWRRAAGSAGRRGPPARAGVKSGGGSTKCDRSDGSS